MKDKLINIFKESAIYMVELIVVCFISILIGFILATIVEFTTHLPWLGVIAFVIGTIFTVIYLGLMFEEFDVESKIKKRFGIY